MTPEGSPKGLPSFFGDPLPKGNLPQTNGHPTNSSLRDSTTGTIHAVVGWLGLVLLSGFVLWGFAPLFPLGTADGQTRTPTHLERFEPGVPTCDSIEIIGCLVLCPAGDQPFQVRLRDQFGNPVSGWPKENVWLNFSDCPSICPCPDEAAWPLVYPEDTSNAGGIVTFRIGAGGCREHCTITLDIVRAVGDTCKLTVNLVRTTDFNCDLTVSFEDVCIMKNCFFQGICLPDPLCFDFNCDGINSLTDLVLLVRHVGHCCGQGCLPSPSLCFVLGDFNDDAVKDVVDVVSVINCVVFTNPPCDQCCADLNYDGIVDIVDIICLINCVVFTTQCPGCPFNWCP